MAVRIPVDSLRIDSWMPRWYVSFPMKSASIQDLQDRTEEVLSWVAGGESVQIHRENLPLAVLQPATQSGPTRADFAKRLQQRCGDTVLALSWADLLSEDRGRD